MVKLKIFHLTNKQLSEPFFEWNYRNSGFQTVLTLGSRFKTCAFSSIERSTLPLLSEVKNKQLYCK